MLAFSLKMKIKKDLLLLDSTILFSDIVKFMSVIRIYEYTNINFYQTPCGTSASWYPYNICLWICHNVFIECLSVSLSDFPHFLWEIACTANIFTVLKWIFLKFKILLCDNQTNTIRLGDIRHVHYLALASVHMA